MPDETTESVPPSRLFRMQCPVCGEWVDAHLDADDTVRPLATGEHTKGCRYRGGAL